MKYSLSIRTLLLLLAPALFTATAFANNQVNVTAAAAQDGNFGLALTMDGSANTTYVRDNTPNGETVYRAQFWVDRRGGIFMDNCGGSCGTRMVVFRGADENHDGGASTRTVFRVIFGRLAVDNASGPRYTVRLGTRLDNGNFRYIGGVVLPETARRKWITVEWIRASGPGANDGICRIYQGNQKGIANLSGERTDLDNDLHEIDYVHLGAIGGLSDQASDPNTSGDLYFDTFESFRTLAP